MTRNALLVLTAVVVLSGCASANLSRYIVPGAKLDPAGKYYVVFSEHDDQFLHELLRTALTERGADVTVGFPEHMPPGIDYLIEYGGRWHWDVTWYLLDFGVRVYEPENRFLIASADSRRTSLMRREPTEVVAETIEALFPQGEDDGN